MNEYAFWSLIAFIFLGALAQTQFPQFFDFEKDKFWEYLVFAGILSAIAVLIMTSIGNFMFGFIYSNYPEIKLYYEKTSKGSLFALLKALLSKKAGIVAVIVFLALFIIGGGRSFTQLDLSLWQHTLAYTFGVGLPEELFKLAVGLYFANRYVVNFDTLDKFDKRKLLAYKLKAIGIIGIAGIGFGFIEAIIYFMDYAKIANHNEMVNAYIVRTIWCIPLHFSWTLIAGAIATQLIFDTETSDEEGWFLIGAFFFGCIVSHGLYDALAHHNNKYFWWVGGISMFIAYFFVLARGKEKMNAIKIIK